VTLMATETIPTNAQTMIDRVREIERECVEQHGVFDRDLLPEEVEDEYLDLCLRLDRIYPIAKDAPLGDFGWRQYKAQRIREVLELFKERKVSTQKAANLIGMTHGDFTRLASRHGIYTSTGGLNNNDELLESIFGKKTSGAREDADSRTQRVRPNAAECAEIPPNFSPTHWAEIRQKLDSVFRPSEGRRWLTTPLDIFEGDRPVDLIARGEGERVMQMLVRIEEGIHV
jgi:hypothetical protein